MEDNRPNLNELSEQELHLSGFIVLLSMSTPILFIVLMNFNIPAYISGIPSLSLLVFSAFLQTKRIKVSKTILKELKLRGHIQPRRRRTAYSQRPSEAASQMEQLNSNQG